MVDGATSFLHWGFTSAPMESPATQPLHGQRIALTGRFASTTQEELALLVEELGGLYQRVVSRATHVLVVGDLGSPRPEDARPTRNLQIARRLRASGYALAITRERQWLSGLELGAPQDEIRHQFTIGQLMRILHVPRSQLRKWMRIGLIEPVRTVDRLAYFDFAQVAGAKRLWHWVSSGVPLPRIVESLTQLAGLFSESQRPLVDLTILEDRGRFVARRASGQWIEPNGQLRFDFADEPTDTATISVPQRDVDDWFQAAVDFEDAGRWQDAAAAYQGAIDLDARDPILHFNLANVLLAQGETRSAARSLRNALTEDPGYAEAWNNLGSVLAELEQFEEAAQAFERAIEVVADYADAHCNLAETYLALNRPDAAKDHWRAYLNLDPNSPWAFEVRRQLARLEEAPKESTAEK